jgi:hypothetical protein
MTWPSQFVAVPTNALVLDERLSPTDKATQQQMANYVSAVPSVHQRLAAGFTDADFQGMHRNPLTAEERQVADAYYHMYSPAGRNHRIEAEFVDGKGLVVTKGRHRFAAAQDVGLPTLPVHVRASDQDTLDRVTRQLESEARESPEVVAQFRKLDADHRVARGEQPIRNEGARTRDTGIERLRYRGH